MAWPHYREIVTVVDVMEANACIDGIKDWVRRHRGRIAGRAARYYNNPYIARAAHSDGYGDMDGDGYGSMSMSGYWFGYGNGNGDGYGYMDGDGYGDMDGNGNGNGDEE